MSIEIGGNIGLDLQWIKLGGGSVVMHGPLAIGPRTVGFRLLQQARLFGGDMLTTTDVAMAGGRWGRQAGSPTLRPR